MSVLNNISLPNIKEEDLSNAQSVKAILNYLAMLDRQLKYALYNLDPEDNFSSKALGTYNEVMGTGEGGSSLRTLVEQTAEAVRIEAERASMEEGRLSSSITTTADGIRSEVNAVIGEGGTLTSKVEQTAQGLSSKVSNGSVISAINQSAESVSINASKINLTGAVTANNNVKIETDGSITAKKAYFGDNGEIEISSENGVVMDGVKANSDGAFVLGPGGAIASSQAQKQILQCLSPDAGHSVNYDVILCAPNGDLRLGYHDSRIPETNIIIVQAGMFYNSADGTYISSDKRLKEDIKEINGSLDLIKKLKPVQFRFKKKPEKVHHGFIAQDVEKLQTDGFTIVDEYKDEGETYKAVDYVGLIADLVGAIQELSEEVDRLKGEKDGNIYD